MTSVQRFFSGRNNLVRSAALSASSVRASTAIERTTARRAGGGRVRLAGQYSGHEAAQVEVEIVAAGGTPRASVPQFVGVGNGQLQVQSVGAGAALQELTFTLSDLGIPTAHATLDAREVQLRARASGAVGNAIRLTLAPHLTRTATEFALLADWPASTATQTGAQWDFGGLPLSAKGELDAASARIAFGFDPQIYRPWRQLKDGGWQFGLSPVLERAQPKGAKVYAVTGGYHLTVTDGVATETYGDTGAGQTAIVTFYDLLTALQASALVEVAGVVVADRAVGGQAAIDVPLRTSAWLLALGGKVQLHGVTVPDQAPTQTVTVRCTNADVVGRERWSVVGDVSGALAVAATGVPYDSVAARFTVPVIDPATPDSGEWSFKYEPAARDEEEGVPSVCVRPFRFGRNAKPRTVTFTYRKRPPADCKCSDMPTPKLSLKCLGIDDGGDMALEPEYQTRLMALYEWRKRFLDSNTAFDAMTDSVIGRAYGYIKSHIREVEIANGITSELAQALSEIYEVQAACDAWDIELARVFAMMSPLEGVDGNLASNMEINLAADVSIERNVYPDTSYGAAEGAVIIHVQLNSRGQSNVFPQESDPWALLESGLKARYIAPLSDTSAVVGMVSARMDYVRTIAGIVPKSDSSSSDAGGCWIDHGDAFWWVDTDGYYLPAFTNQAYVSARRNTETGKPYSTMEFGFGLVVACPDRLKVGDSLTIRINQVDAERPYQVGDEAIIQTVAAGPAWLSGGVDGTDVQTWRVLGSASGPLADYIVPTDGTAAPVYAGAGVTLQIALGGIPFVLGDAFSLAVEAGQYRWRRAGEVWGAPVDIPPSGQAALPDGLQVHFDAGAAPSFAPGDVYAFDVHQPWAASHVQDAQATAWGWAGDGASMVIDLGSVQSLGAVALARYQLPAGAHVALELSQDGAVWSLPLALDVSRPVCVSLFQLAHGARFLRLSVANAAGGSIGWLWCGEPLATDNHASTCQRRRRWAATRGAGLNAPALYAGTGDGWHLGWENALRDEDADALVALVDWAQQHDEPLVFLPHHLHEGDASLVRCAADALDLSDIHEYQPDNSAHRLLSATLELEPVYA